MCLVQISSFTVDNGCQSTVSQLPDNSRAFSRDRYENSREAPSAGRSAKLRRMRVRMRPFLRRGLAKFASVTRQSDLDTRSAMKPITKSALEAGLGNKAP